MRPGRCGTGTGPGRLVEATAKALTIAGANLRRTFRERANLFFVFAFPMLLILVLGVAFGGSYQPRVGVVVQETGPLAGTLAGQLGQAEGIRVQSVPDEAGLTAAVERGELEAGVVIPAGYDAVVRGGGVAELRYLARTGLQGQQVGQIIAAVVDQEAGRLRAIRFAQAEAGGSFDVNSERADLAGRDLPEITVDVRTAGAATFPATLGRFDLGASSQLLLFVFLTALTGSAALIETRRLGVTRRMYSTPTSAATIVAGEALGRLAVALTQSLLIMAGAALIFGVNWGDPMAAGALMLAFALVAASAGLLMGAAARTAEQSLAIGLLLGLGLGALGGAMMPLEFFSSTMRRVAHLTPHAWGLDGFAELVRHDAGILDILPQLGVLLMMAGVLLSLAAWRLRRTITGPHAAPVTYRVTARRTGRGTTP